MSTGLNKVLLIGNLCADPELRSTGSGNAVANLRIATNERRKDRDGNWTDHAEYHTIVCFGKTAENAANYLSKGRQVYVEGRLQTRKWQDKTGADRYSTEIVAHEIKFLGAKGDGPYTSAPAGGGYPDGVGGGYKGGGGGAETDIPFDVPVLL